MHKRVMTVISTFLLISCKFLTYHWFFGGLYKKKKKRIIQKIIFLESTKENPISNGAKEDPIIEVPKENLKKNHINEDPKEDPINRSSC